MNKLYINKMENAFGISSLSFNDKDKYFFQDIIYSRNGTFKTSFSKTLYEISTATSFIISCCFASFCFINT